MRKSGALMFGLALGLSAICTLQAAEPVIPNFWDGREQIVTPHADGIGRIRFLTTIDFPPFSYVDSGGRLAGFHIDLGEAVCEVLDAVDKCSIQALPWEELEEALVNGGGDAILAGIAATPAKRGRFHFSAPYMRFPARFVIPNDSELVLPMHVSTRDQEVGVLVGSAHEAMLRDYFPAARAVTYSRVEWMYADLKSGKLKALFGDGMQLSFWLGSAGSDECCRFAGGPYVSDRYFGEGLTIVTTRDSSQLNNAFNFALRELQSQGTYSELYLRYFPVGFF